MTDLIKILSDKSVDRNVKAEQLIIARNNGIVTTEMAVKLALVYLSK